MISILIVNWNTRDLLRACLLSLHENMGDVEHETIVIDNASADGSAQMVRDEFPEVELVANATNEGYARGNNQAYERARGEWIWLLNSDTEVLPGAAEKLLEFAASRPQAGAFASALIDARDGTIQRSCRTFPTPGALWAEATGLARTFPRSKKFGFYRMGWWNMKTAREVEQPMASSLLLRREAIEEIGGLFDEQFPIFFNDVDLCWRLWQKGWAIWFVPESRVKHWGGASTKLVKAAMIAESHRSMEAFYRKHWSTAYSLPVWAVTLLLMRASGAFRVWRAKGKGQAGEAVSKQ